MNILIVAGGNGTRLWPASRQKKPKQLLTFLNDKTLLQNTYERFSSKIPAKNVYVATAERYASSIQKQLPGVPYKNYSLEPVLRDRAPAIGLAALIMDHDHPNSVFATSWSDSHIEPKKKYLDILRKAEKFLSHHPEMIINVGVKPSFPHTGLGYIEQGKKIANKEGLAVFQAQSFKEKPNHALAKKFLAKKTYLWNTGMFIERVWKWKEEYGEIIYGQLRNLGVSADWSRKRFTMDPAYAEDVMKAFAHYHEKGLLYRGLRTVNWCPRCGTTLSDLELEYADEKTHLWHFIYPLADGSGEVRVATTRPETMLGDTAIAVNPTDPRWKALIGKTVRLPIQEREIPIVGDPSIETEFGTGAVKVTPAHDLTDFELSKRHNLPLLQVIDERGKMTAAAGAEFEGLKTSEAREKVVQKMKDLGLFEKEEPYEHRVTTCGRCGHAIEPIPSMQWFLKMKDLAEKALAAVTEKKVSIRPENFERTYMTWLENVRDWTISRQIWWGHRLPVWFCEREPEKYAVASEKPASCPVCGTCGMKQSEDVLDTWFSSALWPFSAPWELESTHSRPSSRRCHSLRGARVVLLALSPGKVE
jgi:hypothetical protein